MKKPELIENWRECWRFWSVRLSVVGAAIMGVFTAWPDSALYLWGAMPEEVRAFIPQRFVSAIALFVFAMSTVSRIIKQGRKNERIAKESAAEPDAE